MVINKFRIKGIGMQDKKLKVVCIGGGTGQPALLSELKNYDVEITSLPAMLDSGKSSGVIRKHFGMLAPGDMRNCMISLSCADDWIKEMLQHRFESYIPGMSLGNLLFAAANEKSKNFEKAADSISAFLKVRGRVYPSTLENTGISARFKDGHIVEGEDNILANKEGKLAEVWLDNPRAEAYYRAVNAINEADLIIVGPGGFYTSVIPHFLISGIGEAYIASAAKKVFIQNLASQPGVTEGMQIRDYAEEFLRYVKSKNNISNNKKLIDFIIINTSLPEKSIVRKYENTQSSPIILTSEDKKYLRRNEILLIEGDFLSKGIENEEMLIRHDAKTLAEAIMGRICGLKEVNSKLEGTANPIIKDD